MFLAKSKDSSKTFSSSSGEAASMSLKLATDSPKDIEAQF